MKKLNFLRFLPLFLQLSRFGLVGVSAALVHFLVVVFLVDLFEINPLLANIVAFCFASQVSYWGHRLWTFNSTRKHSEAFVRLLLVSGLAFILNETLYAILLNQFHLDYKLALVLVLSILPLAVFTAHKLWVFR